MWGWLVFLYPVVLLFLLVSAVSTGHFSSIISLYVFFFFYPCGNEIEVKQSDPLSLLSPICSEPPSPFVSLGVLCVTRRTQQLETLEWFLWGIREP